MSDTIVLHDVLHAPIEIKEKISDLVVPWVCLYSIATVVSVVALAMKIGVFRAQLLERQTQLSSGDAEQTETDINLSKHRKRLTKTHRRISRSTPRRLTMTYSSWGMRAVAKGGW